MAKENVTFKCGCVKCVQLAFGNHIRCKDQAIYKAYLETQICDDCKKAQREAEQERVLNERKGATAKATAKAEEAGLPKLKGSEKQVAWAMVLRDKALERITKYFPELADTREFMMLKDVDDSKFWIDHRMDRAEALLKKI